MIEPLEAAVAQAFQAQMDRSGQAVDAANLALWQLLCGPRLAPAPGITHALALFPDGALRVVGANGSRGLVDLDPTRDLRPEDRRIAGLGPARHGLLADASRPPLWLLAGARADPAHTAAVWDQWPRAPRDHWQAPAPVRQLAARFVRDVAARHGPLMHALRQPRPPVQDLVLEALDFQSMHDRTVELLGPAAEVSLWRHGLAYHQPAGDWHHASRHRYLLAHDGAQPAAVVGWTQDSGRMGLAYVSVAPAFRRQGLGARMFSEVLAAAQRQRCLLVRSTPSDAARDLGATARFDALALASPTLHVQGGTRLEKALLDAREPMGERWEAVGKSACDHLLRATMKDGGARPAQLDEALAQDIRRTLAPARSSAPRP